MIAIVGTRYADEDSLTFTSKLASELARAGWCIISGGASGIDTAAHEGALKAPGRTVVVCGTPLDRVYPSSNRQLFRRIVDEGGALFSEHSEGTGVYPGMFVARNRLIAALAEAVIVVRAPAKSGALSTAAYAKSMDIPVFFVPAAPWDPRGMGCLMLARRGAKICTSPQDVLSDAALGALTRMAPPQTAPKVARNLMNNISELDEDSRAIVDLLARGGRQSEELVRILGFSAKRVQRALVMLCLAQHIVEKAPGEYDLWPHYGHNG